MPTLLIPGFGGEVPRIEPRTLEAHQSARAVNCDLRRGSLRPLRGVRSGCGGFSIGADDLQA